MNKEQQELVDAAYENYSKEYEKDNSIGMCLLVKRLDGKKTYRKPNKEMFVDLCTSDKTFSEKWGLIIEERELSLEERVKIWDEKYLKDVLPENSMDNLDLDGDNIPKRAISLAYNDTTIESYEN